VIDSDKCDSIDCRGGAVQSGSRLVTLVKYGGGGGSLFAQMTTAHVSTSPNPLETRSKALSDSPLLPVTSLSVQVAPLFCLWAQTSIKQR
jgi:hypothetical protein